MFKISEEELNEYAKLCVEIGVNVVKGQPLVIEGPVEAYELIRKCSEIAYLKGASTVRVDYSDADRKRMSFEYETEEQLKTIPSWTLDKLQYNIDTNYCRLVIIGEDPDLLKGIDSNKINNVSLVRMKATNKFQYYLTNNLGQWCIVAYPELNWAKKVFPDKSDGEAMEALWKAILYTSRVEVNKTVDNWKKHNAEIKEHTKILNKYNFKSLHFKNSLGTDLTVGLIKDHIWEGGCDKSRGEYKVDFNANIPTEEAFTMPDRFNINGTVYSSKPLSYRSNVIPSFNLTFKDGRVVDYKADKNEAILKDLLDTDEGSRSLGEVALVPYDSPISKSNILFYETLFDENASCHLALGACYPTNVKGGVDMSEDELYELGGNKSMNHVDFMFGTSDMSIVGTTYDGEEIEVFRNGNFVF